MEHFARKNHIPIMEKKGVSFLKEYIRDNHIESILEIGSAIGYSAIQMASINPNIHVTTLERDQSRYEEAIENRRKCHMEKQIDIVLTDAFNFKTKQSFDLIFIDAAKSQYTKFFQKFEVNLKEKGTIISDNINFHGLTHRKEEIESKNLRAMVRKIREYITFLEENKQFETNFYEIGDGIAVSVKKQNYGNNNDIK